MLLLSAAAIRRPGPAHIIPRAHDLRSLVLLKNRPRHVSLHLRHFHPAPHRAAATSSAEDSRESIGSNRGTATWPAPKQNNWAGHLGAGGFDLRSDTMTTPTPSMLAAITNCTLLDDVFHEDPTTMELEAHCAALTGKEAGLLVLSGTMGNQLALRSLLTQPPHAVLCDHRSHIIQYEAGGVCSLSGAMIQPVVPRNGIHLTLEDIREHARLGDDDYHACPTRVISLENTLNGMIMPLPEVRRIAQWARDRGLKLHCDGARLWEVAASGGGSLADFAGCFDTVSLCFSKGLGAPIGSVLVGSQPAIRQARWTRKSIGGGLRQSGVVAAAARVAVEETFGKGPSGQGGLLKKSHEMARRIERLWTGLGGKLMYPVQTNMIWLDLKDAGCSDERIEALGRQNGLRLTGPRMITHYQIYLNAEAVLPRLEAVFRAILAEKEESAGVDGKEKAGPRSLYR